MVLEAIELHLRRKAEAESPTDNPTVPSEPSFDELEIEHVMPQRWESHWPLPTEGSAGDKKEREKAVHALGNLTLMNPVRNSKASNRPWCEKREMLKEDRYLFLNRRLLDDLGESEWNEETIRERGRRLAKCICEIWPEASAF